MENLTTNATNGTLLISMAGIDVDTFFFFNFFGALALIIPLLIGTVMKIRAEKMRLYLKRARERERELSLKRLRNSSEEEANDEDDARRSPDQARQANASKALVLFVVLGGFQVSGNLIQPVAETRPWLRFLQDLFDFSVAPVVGELPPLTHALFFSKLQEFSYYTGLYAILILGAFFLTIFIATHEFDSTKGRKLVDSYMRHWARGAKIYTRALDRSFLVDGESNVLRAKNIYQDLSQPMVNWFPLFMAQVFMALFYILGFNGLQTPDWNRQRICVFFYLSILVQSVWVTKYVWVALIEEYSFWIKLRRKPESQCVQRNGRVLYVSRFGTVLRMLMATSLNIVFPVFLIGSLPAFMVGSSDSYFDFIGGCLAMTFIFGLDDMGEPAILEIVAKDEPPVDLESRTVRSPISSPPARVLQHRSAS